MQETSDLTNGRGRLSMPLWFCRLPFETSDLKATLMWELATDLSPSVYFTLIIRTADGMRSVDDMLVSPSTSTSYSFRGRVINSVNTFPSSPATLSRACAWNDQPPEIRRVVGRQKFFTSEPFERDRCRFSVFSLWYFDGVKSKGLIQTNPNRAIIARARNTAVWRRLARLHKSLAYMPQYTWQLGDGLGLSICA